jgi:hypothetical protein
VKTGLADGSQVEILAELPPGTEVIVGMTGGTAATASGGAPFGMRPRGTGGGRR